MKRKITVLVLVVLVIILVAGLDRIVATTLDRELPPLLTRQLGLPVTLAPIRADVISLTARTERLVMGEASDPAIVARQVMVSLNWTDLLRGEIRLVSAAADDVMVKIAAWPSSGNPLPDDYFFLDQWLPRRIDLVQGHYVSEAGTKWAIQNGEWRRHRGGGARLAWTEPLEAGPLGIDVELASLNDFLGMVDFDAVITTDHPLQQLAESEFNLHIAPADQHSYQFKLDGEVFGMQLETTGSGSAAWQWPDQSTSHLAQLEIGAFNKLISSLLSSRIDSDPEVFLASRLPTINLPPHQAELIIDELRSGDEITTNNHLDISSSDKRLDIVVKDARGPNGQLTGDINIVEADGSWAVEVAAELQARRAEDGLLSRFVEAEWYWRSGHAQLKAVGNSWGQLLDAMTGELSLAGVHGGEIETPVLINTRLGSQPDKLMLEELELKIGNSTLQGEVEFSGGRERALRVKLEGDSLDLNFLFDESNAISKPGIAMPEFLTLLPGIEVMWDIELGHVSMPSVRLQKAKLYIDRGDLRGRVTLDASGESNGRLRLKLDYVTQAGQDTRVTMQVEMQDMFLARLFAQPRSILDGATSGTLIFSSEGDDITSIFQAMRGDADLSHSVRADGDWTRPARPEEDVRVTGQASLITEDTQILGVKLENLDLDTTEQDVSGEVTFVAGRSPWVIAELSSKRFNLARVMEWLPESTEAADQGNLLTFLRDAGAMRITFRTGRLDWLEEPLENLLLELESGTKTFDLNTLDFNYAGARLTSKAGIRWQGDRAELTAEGEMKAVIVDQFIDFGDELQKLPLEGRFRLAGDGSSVAEVFADLEGEIKLESKSDTPVSSIEKRKLDVDLRRIPNGVDLKVNTLLWAGSELKGDVRYLRTTPPRLEINISEGRLDLKPWEELETAASEKEQEESLIDSTTRVTGQVAKGLLTAPARFLGAGSSETKPGERIFSAEPMDLTALLNRNGRIRAQLQEVSSNHVLVKDLQVDASLEAGDIQISSAAGFLNGGSANITASYKTAAEPAIANVDLKFQDIYINPEQSTYPRSGHFILEANGRSEAELAASMSGKLYLELGRGLLDYGGMSLLTADAATSMFRTLIPGSEKRQPEIRCGITLVDFNDGIGNTPYGYAARTDTANLLGGIEVDMKKEHLVLRFQSRSRQGVGISVGNAFSSTVNIAGPLSDPRLVPNTPGMILRGWAAFMTAGMSVLGESMFNRALASANPCDSIRDEIRKNVCVEGDPLASSPLACPDVSG